MKEKLEEARVIYETASDETKRALESLFPELKENEDERIRQMIKNTLRDAAISERISETSYREMSDYLEKQKEQKLTESLEDIHNRGYVKGVEDAYNNVNEAKVILKRLAKENPKSAEWSEKDEFILKNIRDFVNENIIDPNRVGCVEECLEWIDYLPKRFNLQSHWKPSKEQMKALRELLDFNIGVFDYNLFQIVNQLYSDLQKYCSL